MGKRSVSLICFTLLVLCACQKVNNTPLSKEQALLKSRVDSLEVIDSLFVPVKKITLKLPQNAFLDNLFDLLQMPGGYAIVNCQSKTIITFDAEGNIIGKFGREGDGPGEFRGWIKSCSDFNNNVYIYDEVQKKISIFDRIGKLIKIINTDKFNNVMHICVNKAGLIFLHKAPSPQDNNYVAVYDTNGYVKSLIKGNDDYKNFYQFLGVDGGLLSLENGDVIETNSYSYRINKISPELSVFSFGEKIPGFVELKKEPNPIKDYEKQMGIINSHTSFIKLIGFNENKNIIRFSANTSKEGENINKVTLFYEIYDSEGNSIANKEHKGALPTFGNEKHIGFIHYFSNFEDGLPEIQLLKYKY